MQRSTTHHHRGVCAGLLLAVSVAALGFFMQAALAQGQQGRAYSILIGASLLLAGLLALICFRNKQ